MRFWAKIDFNLKLKGKTNEYNFFKFFIHFFIF